MSTIPRLTNMTFDEALDVLSSISPELQAEAIVERSMPLEKRDVLSLARSSVARGNPTSRYVVALAGSLRDYDRRQANKPSRKTKKNEERVQPTLGERWGVNTFGEIVSPIFSEIDRTLNEEAPSDESARSSHKKEG